jgi:hypothetical protein
MHLNVKEIKQFQQKNNIKKALKNDPERGSIIYIF